jgi:hypothetical protein
MTKAIQLQNEEEKVGSYLIQKLHNELGFPTELIQLYQYNITDILQDFNINGWKFHNPLDIVLKASNYPNFIDFASRYIGMGWIEIIAFSPKTQMFFYRCDGGSSGLEVEYNEKYFKNFCLSNANANANSFRFPSYNFSEMIERTNQEFKGIY